MPNILLLTPAFSTISTQPKGVVGRMPIPWDYGHPGWQQANGVFTFGLPPVGQPYFVSSTKTTKTFSLDEGLAMNLRWISSVERVRMPSRMAFIPTARSQFLGGIWYRQIGNRRPDYQGNQQVFHR